MQDLDNSLLNPTLNDWEKIADMDLTHLTIAQRRDAYRFCEEIVFRFSRSFVHATALLPDSGLRFLHEKQLVWKEQPVGFGTHCDSSLPLLLQAWCNHVEFLNVQQETSQMVDYESPFRGFAMFGKGMIWSSKQILILGQTHCEEDPCLELRGDTWLLNCFTTDFEILATKANPHTIDPELVGDEDHRVRFSHLLRKNASCGGYPRLWSAATADSSLAPQIGSIPMAFPIDIDF